MSSTRTSRFVRASREAVYQAFVDPAALAIWLAPDGMTGRIHEFDARVGGGFRMSLFYPESDTEARGKTAPREDRFFARFVELSPPERIAERVTFESADSAFNGEMTMTVLMAEVPGGTDVTIQFDNIPPGISPEDNDTGTRQSLAKLARLVESAPAGSR